ncbi:MAG: ImmA/IrrE family metallo-endopeptidase [Bifidobacteriales bacterium]|nr:ImmA/IrrE family metallo-endopeptidase [Bifidobacteriales bacterium]
MGHRIARLYDEADAMGVTVRECDIAHTDYCGLYDDAHRLVILDQALNDRQRLWVLQHELVHAEYHDRMCGYHSDAKWERRTRRETADRLISLTDYRMAESVYDSDPAAMAQELGVVRAVLEDYQEMLDELHSIQPYRHDWSEDMLVGA